MNAVMNLRVPYNAGNFLTSWEAVNFSRRTLLRGVSKVKGATFYVTISYNTLKMFTGEALPTALLDNMSGVSGCFTDRASTWLPFAKSLRWAPRADLDIVKIPLLPGIETRQCGP